ncbi:PKD domain-containing protein [Pontibacter sp. MBLB2868]|uniref:PKD domain-containing protein n=1 Tax=Pontibacter sp. MBLB2868 TaxID=3451555 RepID=UPI003F756A70
MEKRLHSLTMSVFIFLLTLTACSKEDTVSPTQLTPSPPAPPTPNPPPTTPPPVNNSAPIARAGNDTTIYVPFNSHVLNGNKSTDPDGNIVTYNWRFIKGPSEVPLNNFSDTKGSARGLFNVGDYEFELTVTDAYNLKSKDTVTVTVAQPTCTTANKEVIFKDLTWSYPWLMETGIGNLFSFLPANSYIKDFYIKRDGSDTWEKIINVDLAPNNTGTIHTWEFFEGRLIIYPNSNQTEDTPDVKVEYCN